MKTSIIRIVGYNLFLFGFLFIVSCNNSASKENTDTTKTANIEEFADILWNVKAILPDGKSLDINAFNSAGEALNIKAIQNSDQDNLLDIKAIAPDGNKLPVKILVSKNQFSPVVAITDKGNAYKLKALTAEGEELQIIGVARYGNIVIMKAVTKKGKFYGVKAISPTGQLNDVKGIKINAQERDMTMRTHSVYAHVKAMHPSTNEDEFKLPKKNIEKGEYKTDFKRIKWNIKAVTADGENLDIKAFDENGNVFDVKATQNSKQHSFMNIRAFAEGAELPIKIIQSSTEDEYAPIKAIGRDGTIYDVKALTEDGIKLDVKGISRSGNIIHVKAINENGEFYAVKAFSPDGKLNQVKGIKIFDREVEMKVQGNPVYAHLKAINQ